MSRSLCSLMLLALLSCSGFADTTWVNNSTVTGEWNSDHSPYMIQCDVHVPARQSLTIRSGVTVFFTGPFVLHVDSTAVLNAWGGEADSIFFTTDTLSNPARWGGVQLFYAGDFCHFDYCVFQYTHELDSAQFLDHGQGLNAYRTAVVLSHSAIRYCRTSNDGGGVHVRFGLLTMTDCVLSHNRSHNGGGAMTWAARVYLENDCFEDNFASGGGGGLDFTGGATYPIFDTLRIVNCAFRNNQSFGPLGGGGITLEFDDSDLTMVFIEHSAITDNQADHGGGLNGLDGTGRLVMTDCLIARNHATNDGGGIDNLNSTRLYQYWGNGYLERCVFDGNTAVHGGAIDISHVDEGERAPILRNCTFVRNFATSHGSAINNDAGGSPLLINTLLAFNRGMDTYTDAPHADGSVRYCDFFGNAGRNFFPPDSAAHQHVLYLDPLFADTAAADFHLTAGSPCIDAGWNSDLQPRDPDGTAPDIGAFFFDHRQPAPVQNLTAAVIGDTLRLRWSPVTTDVQGNPVTVDHYLIYAAATAGAEPSILVITTQTHYSCLIGSNPQRFYTVTAVSLP